MGIQTCTWVISSRDLASTGPSLVSVVAYRWVPELFLVLAGTMLLAALILGSHAVIRKMTEPKDPDKAA